jgi:hypothetical protein
VKAVEKYFFTPLYFPRTAWSVLRWWETRRPLYNAAVGTAGLFTLGVVAALSRLPPGPAGGPADPAGIVGGVLFYGVLANLCYSLGAPADLLLRRLLGERAAAAGPVLFRYGFVFSIGLTLLPVPLAALSWLFRLVFG